MKTILKTFIIASVWCLAASCGEPELTIIDPPTPFPSHLLINQSDHTVSIVQKPSVEDFPDSLVLLNGETFEFSKSDFFLQDFEARTIYYDGRYALNFDDLPADRAFYNSSVYRYEPGMLDVFTFVEEDYQFAVENGTDLGEKQ